MVVSFKKKKHYLRVLGALTSRAENNFFPLERTYVGLSPRFSQTKQKGGGTKSRTHYCSLYIVHSCSIIQIQILQTDFHIFPYQIR